MAVVFGYPAAGTFSLLCLQWAWTRFNSEQEDRALLYVAAVSRLKAMSAIYARRTRR
jgi:hypothetical protein